MISISKVFRVAKYELNDALRSRRFIVVLALYILGAGGACFGFISVLHRIEIELAGALGLAASDNPGAVADALWKSVTFQRMVTNLVGDSEVAKEVLTIPPLALIYGWLAFTFTPILVMLSCPGRIAEDTVSGFVRYSLIRASRTEWCIGKYIGQALEIIIPLMLSAISAWTVARFRLQSMAGPEVILSMIIYGWKVWVYCLAFVGLALGVSQICKSPNQSTALALIVWVGLAIGGSEVVSLVSGEGWRQFFDVFALLAPGGHKLDLWRTNPAYVIPASVYVIALGSAYFSIGHFFFLRKDV